jgi:YjbR
MIAVRNRPMEQHERAEANADAHPFEAVVAALANRPGVRRSMVFGMPALKVDGKVFAAYADRMLVVKLPADRIETLLTSGKGKPFVGYGKTMRAWVALPLDTQDEWRALAEAAQAFVSASKVR